MLSPVAFYKCLAEETRLKVILLISLKGELCVCDLVAALALSQPKVSRHLAELRKCGLLLDERRGKWVYYQLNQSLPQWARTVLEQTAHNTPQFLSTSLSQLEHALKTRECS